jgi:N-acetylglucosamine-6-sulfatase
MPHARRTIALAALTLALAAPGPLRAQARAGGPVAALSRVAGVQPRNVVFVLSDDHRYDAMGFMGHPIVETPNLDRIAARGVHLRNAFVTTALCSPSRASILTGLYAHQHKVVDNNTPVPAGTTFFPQYLQRAGYQTALVGKWHMGGDDGGPQPGFDHWVSFRGQGSYLPSADGLNVDGKKVPQRTYITDELTDYAMEWLRARDRARPFFLYLSHKGVHNDWNAARRTSDFIPAERHRGKLEGRTFTPPKSQSYPPEQEALRPRWVRDQRNSWHGVDYPYHSTLDVGYFFKRYAETLLAVDESVGRVLDYLSSEGLLDSTLVVYMGDNGFAFGEHGLIDKRTAYEESMRVPMVMQCPELFPGGRTVDQVVANLDVAPTILAAAGLTPPAEMVGRSILPLARGEAVPWRTELLYEYYWERNFPQTPTVFALRADRYKFIRYHGLWDVDELFDLQADPLEMTNLAYVPAHAERVEQMSARVFALLAETDGRAIPLYPDRGAVFGLRAPGAQAAAPFPPVFVARPREER